MADAPPKKQESAGAPAWMGTFADLMSLLMCFFVLLLSFAEMDVIKFKQIADSMKFAFGVQRDIEADAVPMGTSVIAQDFSPGKPTDTAVDSVRQETTDEEKQTLEFTDALVEEVDALDQTDTDAEFKEEVEPETLADAEALREALSEEIKEGMIEVEAKGATIVIRIREKGSFGSGDARFSPQFVGVLGKIEETLVDMDGRIVVAGHTDNIPIKTARFRSNWDLSSARAVSVVHALLDDGKLASERFMVEGYADAQPVAPNDTPENRALNRRVEMTIIQGEPERRTPTAVIKLDGSPDDATRTELLDEAVETFDAEPTRAQASPPNDGA